MTICLKKTPMKHCQFPGLILVAILIILAAVPLPATTKDLKPVREVSLDQAVQEALNNNHRRPASCFAVALAEAQHRQALAAYWPQLTANLKYVHLDEPLNFIVSETIYNIPGQSVPLPPGTSISLNTLTAPQQKITQLDIPPLDIKTPPKTLTLRDDESVFALLQAQWMLYDGGLRKGNGEKTRANIAKIKQEVRRTDLEIIDSVKRYYYGTVLARQLHQIGMDTLARMEATLNLTESMYKEGSGQVKKTDWLSTKVMVETLRSMVALLEKNQLMSQATLANVMGLPWNASVRATDQIIPFTTLAVSLEDLITTTYTFNPDWARMEADIRAAQGAIRAARSGYFPKAVLKGKLHKWWNDHTTESATDENKEGWTLGVEIEIPLFDGFLTQARVAQAKNMLSRIREQKILLKENLGLQVRDIFLSMAALTKAHQATHAAMEASAENRKLNTRAYQHGLVKTEDLIQAQLVEALMSARHYKTLFDHMALQSKLGLTVGRKVLDLMGET